VRDLADLRAQLLRAGDQRAELALVDEVEYGDRREDEEAHQSEHGVGDQHADRRGDEHDHHAHGHRQRRQRRPRRLGVGAGVGQQLPGRVPLVPGQRQPQVLLGDVAAGAGLHAVLHDAGEDPPARDADRLEQGRADDQ
jgi:hypothetical protein